MPQSLEERAQNAVNAALESNWDRAILLNQEILTDYPDDIDTLNRLAKSLLQKGQANQAIKTYRKVLQLDPYNPIAQKNLKGVTSNSSMPTGNAIDPNLFLEEPGKTKIVMVQATPESRQIVHVGDEVFPTQAQNDVIIYTSDKKKVGLFDADFTGYFIRLLKLGNRYCAHVFAIEENSIGIFLRETKRSADMKDCVSFPTAGNRQYRSFLKEDLLSLISDQSGIQSEAEEEYDEKLSSEEPSFDDAGSTDSGSDSDALIDSAEEREERFIAED